MPEVKTITEPPLPRRSPLQRFSQEKGPGPLLPPPLHQAGCLSLRRSRMGAPPRSDHRCPGQRDLRAEGRRGPQRLVHDCHQHRGLEVPARQDWHARAREGCSRPGRPRRRDHPRLGHGPGLLPHRTKTAPPSTTNSCTSSSASTRPSIRPSGSTSDATASSPTPTARTGTGTRRRSRSNSASPAIPSRSALPVSSIR